jgi:transcription factor C subunit 6
MSAGRRSGRLKGPRTVYVDDPFEAAGISDEEEESNKSKVSSKRKGKRAEAEDLSSDDEFVAGSGEEADHGLDEDEAEVEAADDPEEELGSQAGASEPEEMWIDAVEGTPRKERLGSHQRDTHARKRRADGTVVPYADETHSRGIIEPRDHLSKTTYYTLTFGTDDRDLMAAVHSRMRWNKALDVTFPSRAALEDREKKPSYLYGPTFGVHPDDVLKESTRGWDWYYDRDTGPMFKKKQRIHNIKESILRQKYLPQPDARKHGILLGPHNNQQLYKLGYHETFDFGKAWGDRSTQPGRSKTGTQKIREGWILNIGHKALCMAWAPNQDGLTQYLAVVAPITEAQKAQYTPEGSEPTTPFRPSNPTPSALQIWEFKGKQSETPTMSLDMETKPRLRQVLCADWGDLRRMSWNNMPRAKREDDEEEAKKSIGLLATVWGDGKVRVLDIKTERGSQKTEFRQCLFRGVPSNPLTRNIVKVESPAFEARPPATVCTCVTWLSPGDLAVGCGNGFVAAWNIKPCSGPEPLPFFYRPIHATYILSITSAYPAHPQIMITVAMDGETRMWSTIDTSSELASTVRMRGASAHISYSPLCQSVVAGDENEFARIIPIRRFFSTTVIARFRSNISAMAPSSTHHPCALFGSAAGEVAGTNPFRRILYNKEQIWQQMWFTHEWVRPNSKTDTLGISRFYDGYRAENQKLAKYKMSESKPILGMGTSTIYEEGTHVTALGWNPNRQCAGWASAALGCGLLRVEDLAI